MSFKEQLESGRFVIAAELQPPKGNALSELYEYAGLLKGRVDAVNIPDLQNAIMRLGSLSVCALLKASDKQQASVEIAGNLIRELRGLCQGAQIIPIGWEKQIPGLLDYVGL